MLNKNITLQNCGFSTAIEREDDGTIDITVQALHTGIFFDMNGTEVLVNQEMLDNIATSYNESLKMIHAIDSETDPKIRDVALQDFEHRNAPNQINHDASDALKTVGHLVGFMKVKEINNKHYLFCKIRVCGKDNIERVRDKRFRNMSVQFNPETYEFVEISWVVKGAAYEAHALMSGGQDNDNRVKVLPNLSAVLDKIHVKRESITLMKKKLDATKRMIALSRTGLINMAQIRTIKPELDKFTNPEEVIKLLESVIPSKTFKPQVINDSRIVNKLLKGTDMINKVDNTKSLSLIDALKNVKLGEGMSGVEHACIGEDNILGYDDVAEKHMDLMTKSMEGYEKGDMEMGRKFGELAKKLAGEVKAKKAKLADYDVDALSEESEEVKELSKKIKASEEEVKEDVKKELAAFEEKITVMLASKADASKEQIKDIQQAIVLLTNLAAGVK